jgi:hypothetical protein
VIASRQTRLCGDYSGFTSDSCSDCAMSCYGDDSIADDVNSGAHVAGMTADEVTQYYNTWALQGTYEQVGKQTIIGK